MNNQLCMVMTMPSNLYLDELLYYPFIINMSRSDGSCNTAEDSFERICVPNKMKDVNLKVHNMIKQINESKTLVKHIGYECRCEFGGRKCS